MVYGLWVTSVCSVLFPYKIVISFNDSVLKVKKHKVNYNVMIFWHDGTYCDVRFQYHGNIALPSNTVIC